MLVHVHDLVAHGAARHGGATALTARDRSVTYAELWRDAAACGAGLRRIGLRRGDRVAIYLDKRVETVAAILGASVAGAAFVPVNPLLRPRQVEHILRDSGARALVTSPDRLELLRASLPDAVEHAVVVADAAPAQEAAAGPRVHGWSELLAGAPPAPAAAAGGIDVALAAILYTSGSTGRPKGVVLSHRNLLAGAASVSSYLGNDERDVILAALPLSFDAGLSQLTTGFHAGAHVVLLDYLLAGDVMRACARHRVTGLTGVPPLWIQLAELEWPAEATASLRYFANTGGRMPRPTLDRLRAIFPAAEPFLMYGLTEAFRSTYLDPAEVDRRPDSIGRAIPNAEVLVVRPDGSECDPEEPGELVHRGALVALGYWNDPERTAARFKPAPGRDAAIPLPEPAVWSGDLVKRDAEGFLYFVGRDDEMIKTSGYRVSPTEIEEVAYETGGVRDAVAFGVEDPQVGQRVVLVVSARDGEPLEPARLRSALRRQLPRYMVPREIVVRDELPRSPNGKLDRALLRAELEAA